MNLNTLTLNFVNREDKERVKGRYWSSQLYAIISGKLKPKDFYKKEKKDLIGCSNILRGYEKEETLKKVLDFNKIPHEYQNKVVLKIDEGIEIVVVADFVLKDRVLEVKAPNRIDGIKPWHLPQLQAQSVAFGKPVWVMYVANWDSPLFLQYKPDDHYWKYILQKVFEFHQQVPPRS
jgi:hypothetical protein